MKRSRKPWTPEHLESLRRLYPTTPAHVLAEQLGHPIRSVWVKAGQLGLRKSVIIRRPTPSPWNRKYTINEAAFTSLTPETAYVLGLIAADGNLAGDGCTSSIANKDRGILEKARAALGATYPIKGPDHKGVYKLTFFNQAIYTGLLRRGLVPRKSLVLQMPDVPESLFFHFLRGYFDGDGTVTLKSGTLRLAFTSGSAAMLRAVAGRVAAALGAPAKALERHATAREAYVLTYHGPTALMIAETMYRDCGDLCMARKRERFEQYRVGRKRVVRPRWMK